MNNFNKGGSEYITKLIDEAVNDGSRTATVSGNWIIDEAVRIPSNFTLILEDCHLRLADGSYTNIFVNEHHDTELGRTVSGRDRNIAIIGRGEAILDGGEYNGLSERNHRRVRRRTGHQRTVCRRYGRTIFCSLRTLRASRSTGSLAAISVGGH